MDEDRPGSAVRHVHSKTPHDTVPDAKWRENARVQVRGILRQPTSVSKAVASFGRLGRPSTQPAKLKGECRN
jgi:hypothetical protein